MTITRSDMNHRRSRIVTHGDTIYLSGMVAPDTDGDMTHQAKAVMAHIDTTLAQAGSDKSKILSATIWIKTMNDFKAFNAVWDTWIDPENPPARACGEVRMAREEILVEIIIVAAK